MAKSAQQDPWAGGRPRLDRVSRPARMPWGVRRGTARPAGHVPLAKPGDRFCYGLLLCRKVLRAGLAGPSG